MKKLLTLLAVAMVFTLAGCSDADTDISKADEAIITIGDKKITKGDIYKNTKKSFGAAKTLNKVLNTICDKEKIKLTDEMKKEAETMLATAKSSGGDQFSQQLKDSGYKNEKEYVESEIYPNIRQQGLVKKYVKEKQKALFKTYSPRKAEIVETTSKDNATAALASMQAGGNMKDVATANGDTTTYSGEEAIYTSKGTLPTAVYDKIKTAKKTGLITTIIEDTENSKFYVVNVTNIDPTSFKDEAISAIVEQGSTTLSTAASEFYLKKYEFKVYDGDIYNGLKTVNESYVNY